MSPPRWIKFQFSFHSQTQKRVIALIVLSSPHVTMERLLLGCEKAMSLTPPIWASICSENTNKSTYSRKTKKVYHNGMKLTSSSGLSSPFAMKAYVWTICFENATPERKQEIRTKVCVLIDQRSQWADDEIKTSARKIHQCSLVKAYRV